jgi:ribulose-5-phosphate 4-epimerase/fuculose-1-phosphate aldolase
MLRTNGIDPQILEKFAARPGERPLLPPLSSKAQVALMCRMLSREGWNEHIAGHITVRQPDGTVLTNPWELAWDELRASDIVTIDQQGQVLDSQWNTTPAIALHLQIHQLRPDVNVVVHNHAHWSGIWANLQQVPAVYDQAGGYCGAELPLYNEYSGTFEKQDLSRSAAEALGDAKWALLAHHGALVVGKDLRQAHLRVVTLEWRCKRAYEVKLAGGAEPLANDVVEQLAVTDAKGFPFCWEAMARRELREDPSILE